jgi:hypothetical protein
MTVKKTIMIAGDSWSLGEHTIQPESGRILPNIVPNTGLQFFLERDGHSVINLGGPGKSNCGIYTSIVNFLALNPRLVHDVTTCIVFQTEWQRDFWHRQIHQPEISTYCYSELQQRWIHRLYIKLSDLSKTSNIQFYLIGGASDCYWEPNFSLIYPGVYIVCQSMFNLLYRGDHLIQHPVYASMMPHLCVKVYEESNHAHDTEYNKNLLLSDIENCTNRSEDYALISTEFSNDGIHPNRKGFEILYNHLKKSNLQL